MDLNYFNYGYLNRIQNNQFQNLAFKQIMDIVSYMSSSDERKAFAKKFQPKASLTKAGKAKHAKMKERFAREQAVLGKGHYLRPLPVKKGVKKGFKKKVNESKVRLQLTKALAVPNTYSGEYGDTFVSTASTNHIPCLYFCMFVSDPIGSMDPATHRSISANIVFQINGPVASNQDIQYEQTGFRMQHTLTNANNFAIRVRAYKLEARRDLPNVGQYAIATNSVLTALGQGFANRSIDSGNAGSTNGGLIDNFLTPYNSAITEAFKIVKKKTVIMQAGTTSSFYIKDNKSHMIRPDQFLQLSGGGSYGASTITVAWRKGESFWLFQANAEQLGTNATKTIGQTYTAGTIPLVTGATAYTTNTTNTTGTPSNNISSQVFKVIMYTKYQYEYKFIQDSTPVNIFNTNGGSLTAPSGVVAIIDKLTGTIQEETSA